MSCVESAWICILIFLDQATSNSCSSPSQPEERRRHKSFVICKWGLFASCFTLGHHLGGNLGVTQEDNLGTAGALIWRLPNGCFGTIWRHPLGYVVITVIPPGHHWKHFGTSWELFSKYWRSAPLPCEQHGPNDQISIPFVYLRWDTCGGDWVGRQGLSPEGRRLMKKAGDCAIVHNR